MFFHAVRVYRDLNRLKARETLKPENPKTIPAAAAKGGEWETGEKRWTMLKKRRENDASTGRSYYPQARSGTQAIRGVLVEN